MIQAEELRIGNYVGFGDNLCAVCEIQKEVFYVEDFISSEEYKSSWADLKPITLTEEILLKCGFVIKNNWALKPNFCLGCITTDEYYQIEVKIAGIEKWNILEVKYLHQLQNLYFSLIGEELEINLYLL